MLVRKSLECDGHGFITRHQRVQSKLKTRVGLNQPHPYQHSCALCTVPNQQAQYCMSSKNLGSCKAVKPKDALVFGFGRKLRIASAAVQPLTTHTVLRL